MDETERMVALKNAYAEMILNTSKEAAARVMTAEGKAQKFEQDLLSTKEEALRMLLRLKQMIDAKSSEAEMTSSNQNKRIHELEAQLDEAEGLILDLREKLSKVQEQLDVMKCKNIHSMRPDEKVSMPSQVGMAENEQSHFASLKSFPELEPKFVTSDIHTSEPGVLVHECLTSAKGTAVSNSEINHYPMYVPVFASGITKNTEPELYTNGCTQRIRAIETGLADEKLHHIDEILTFFRSKPNVKKKVQSIGSDIIPSSRTQKLDTMENSVKQAAIPKNTRKGQPVKVACHAHRRKTRYAKGKATSCRILSGKSTKLHRTSSAISRCKSHSHTSKDADKSGDTSTSIENMNEVNASELKENVPLEKDQKTVSVVRRSLRKRKIKHWDDFATSSRQHEACTHSGGHEDSCQNKKMMRTVAKTAKSDAKAGEDVLGVEHGGENEECIQSKAAFANYRKCLKAEEGFRSVGVQPNRITPDTELKNILSVHSDLRESNTSKPYSNKPLKYTFSRKRKNGSSINSNKNHSIGEISVKKCSGEENSTQLAPENSNLVDESSSYGRGLVQVACQLISLSAERWW